jgi:hypothetical protein
MRAFVLLTIVTAIASATVLVSGCERFTAAKSVSYAITVR